MKGIRGTAIFCLIVIITVVSVFSSKRATLYARATEDILDIDDNVEDAKDAEDVENIEDAASAEVCIEENLESEISELPEKIEKVERKAPEYRYPSLMDALFYIYNGDENSLPYEPSNHDSRLYSTGIAIRDAVDINKVLQLIADYEYFPDAIVDQDLDDEISEDNYTVSNDVLSVLANYPDEEQIKSVYSDFDSKEYFVQWYVIKSLGNIHIDGVVRRKNKTEEKTDDDGIDPAGSESSEASSESSSTATESTSAATESTSAAAIEVPTESTSAASEASSVIEPASSEDEEPNITIEVEAICNNPIVPDDGEAHLVGDGFKIRIIDNDHTDTILEKIYDRLGNFLKNTEIKVSAAGGDGTTFEYKHHKYWINVDAAYAYVTAKDISEKGLAIPFIFKGEPVEEINVKVWDKAVQSFVAIENDASKVEVVTKKPTISADNVLTIEAGSTVKNDDGKTLTNDSYDIISGALKEGHSISNVVFNGSQTGVGESSNEITSVTIIDAQGNDVSSQYVIKCKKGKLILVDNSGNEIEAEAHEDVSGRERSGATSETVGKTSFNISPKNEAMNDMIEKNSITVITEERMSTVRGSTILGARLSATYDNSMDENYRIAIISLCIVMCMAVLCMNTMEQKDSKKG